MRLRHGPIAHAACLALTFCAAGCNVAIIGGAVLLATQGSGSKSDTFSTPTPVSIETPTAVLVDRAEIRYSLRSSPPRTFDVRVEYSTSGDAGAFHPATEALGAPSQGTRGLSASSQGNPHVFVWNSFYDLDRASFVQGKDVVVRITASEAGSDVPFGLPATTSRFAVDERLIATVAGSPAADGERIAARLVPAFQPRAAAVGSGTILVADTGNARVRSIDATTDLVTTFAGSSRPGFGGDGGPAAAALLLAPGALAVDSSGNAFIADTGNNRVRRVDAATGIVASIAGIGSAGFSGDGGPAALARLSAPSGLAVDGSGTIYVADTGNHRVRALAPSGTITTVAGTGVAGGAGDGGPGTAAQLSSPSALAFDAGGALLIADSGNHAIRRLVIGGSLTTVAGVLSVEGRGAEDVRATASPLRTPSGLAFVAGAVYVSDTGNNRVRRFVPGLQIATVAGALDATAGFAGDGGSAPAALFAGPTGLAADGAGGVLVADTGNNRVRRLDASGLVTTILGSGATDAANVGDGRAATLGRLFGPWQVSLDAAGVAYVADGDGNRARRFDVGGTITTVAGTGGSGIGGDGLAATLTSVFPRGVAVDSNGIVFIAEGHPNNRIRAIHPGTSLMQTIAGAGTGPDGPATSAALIDPQALLALPGNVLLVSEFKNGSRIRAITYDVDPSQGIANALIATVCGTAAAGFAGDGGAATSAQLSAVGGMDVDALGRIYFVDQGGNCIRRFSIGGAIATVAGSPVASGFGGDGGPATSALFAGVQFVAVDRRRGTVYVADHANHRVRAFADGGTISTVAGTGSVGESGLGGPATEAELPSPLGIAVASDGSVFVGSTGTRRVYRFTPGGTIDAVAGLPSSDAAGDGGSAIAAVVNQPFPAVAPDGTLAIGERNFGRIRSVDPRTGTITTVIGKGILSSNGDGPLDRALIDECWGLAVDRAGNLVLSEKEASPPVVRKIDVLAHTIATVAGGGSGAGGSGDGGLATGASLAGPEGSACSPTTGALYIVDSDLGTVRRVAPDGTIATVAGGGTSTADGVPALAAQLDAPCAVAVDASETIYVVQRAPSSAVRRFTVGGPINLVAGVPGSSGFNGDEIRATEALLDNPQGVAVDAAGNVYIADSQNHRVRRVDPRGFITTVAGTGEAGSGPDGVPAASSKLNGPRQIQVDARGNIFVGEEFGNRVRRFRAFP